ncbi:hypothetical protein OROGR_021403 [Orobanche gracilis]
MVPCPEIVVATNAKSNRNLRRTKWGRIKDLSCQKNNIGRLRKCIRAQSNGCKLPD